MHHRIGCKMLIANSCSTPLCLLAVHATLIDQPKAQEENSRALMRGRARSASIRPTMAAVTISVLRSPQHLPGGMN